MKGHDGCNSCRPRRSLIGRCLKIATDCRSKWTQSQFHRHNCLARVFTRQILAPRYRVTPCLTTNRANNHSCKPAFTLRMLVGKVMGRYLEDGSKEHGRADEDVNADTRQTLFPISKQTYIYIDGLYLGQANAQVNRWSLYRPSKCTSKSMTFS